MLNERNISEIKTITGQRGNYLLVLFNNTKYFKEKHKIRVNVFNETKWRCNFNNAFLLKLHWTEAAQ